MQFNSMQLEAAHELGEAILRFVLAVDSQPTRQTSDAARPSSKPAGVDCGDNRLLRANEVAELLALGKSKVYDLMSSGRLPSIQIDGARRFKMSEVKKLMENGARPD